MDITTVDRHAIKEARDILTDTYTPLWAAKTAMHNAAERLAALVAVVLFGPTVHIVTFDYDGDADGETWLVPLEAYDATGRELDHVETVDADDLADRYSEAVRDLIESEIVRVDLPYDGDRRVLGLVIADVLADKSTPVAA
jgi:hypothetical protein